MWKLWNKFSSVRHQSKSVSWLQHFRVIPFLIGLLVGYVLIIWYKPPPILIYEYPHPDNINNRIYKDKNGVCYSYTVADVDCDKNEGTLKPYPIQL